MTINIDTKALFYYHFEMVAIIFLQVSLQVEWPFGPNYGNQRESKFLSML